METLIITGDVNGNDLPWQITTPFPSTPTSITEIENRISLGGNLTLENAVMVFGEIDPHSNSVLFMGVSHLKLINSHIITNGNVLDVFCQSIEVDSQSTIRSFSNDSLQAKMDELGDDGGFVNLYLLDECTGSLDVNLSAQNGGDGSQGSKGKTGNRGYRGRGGRNGSFGTCLRGPGKGGPGGKGGKGGNGLDGQNGGDGGTLNILFIEKEPTSSHVLNFTSKGGTGGNGGPGGEGGKGGKRGRNGSNAGNCDRLRPPYAADGPQGDRGNKGDSGENGQNGSAFTKKILIGEL